MHCSFLFNCTPVSFCSDNAYYNSGLLRSNLSPQTNKKLRKVGSARVGTYKVWPTHTSRLVVISTKVEKSSYITSLGRSFDYAQDDEDKVGVGQMFFIARNFSCWPIQDSRATPRLCGIAGEGRTHIPTSDKLVADEASSRRFSLSTVVPRDSIRLALALLGICRRHVVVV